MARTVRNAKLDTRSARVKCETRREPYWQKIAKGCFVGYRRSGQSGTWVARMRDDVRRQHYQALGAADDNLDANGETVLTFAQAQEAARKFFEEKTHELAGREKGNDGPFTVRKALEAYFAERRREGSKGLAKDLYAANARIIPALG
jgi:hypothetical protein